MVRVHGTRKALAITTDCTPRYCKADPYEGGKQAIAEAWRNLCAVGARPLAATDCMNFGNPQRPEIMGQFVGCIEGMAEACRALDFPIVSGNVSLYNETKAEDGTSQAILPTPAIGGVGLIDDWEKAATHRVQGEGETIIWSIGARPRPSRPVALAARSRRAAKTGRRRRSIWRRASASRRVRPRADRRTGWSPPSTTSPTAACWSRSRKWRWPETSERTSDRRASRTARPCRRCSSARTRAAMSSRQPDSAAIIELSARIRRRRRSRWIGTTGGDSSADASSMRCAACDVPLADLRAAHEGFFPKLMGDSLTAS